MHLPNDSQTHQDPEHKRSLQIGQLQPSGLFSTCWLELTPPRRCWCRAQYWRTLGFETNYDSRRPLETRRLRLPDSGRHVLIRSRLVAAYLVRVAVAPR